MALRRKRGRRTKAQKTTDAVLTAIGFVFAAVGFLLMAAIKMTMAAGVGAVRASRFIVQKIQHMRSPPAGQVPSTPSKPPAVKANPRPNVPGTMPTRKVAPINIGAPISKPAARPVPPVATATRPRVPTPSTAPTTAANTSPSGPGRWIPPGKSIVVHGITIAGGLLYAGTSLKTATGQDDPCLIDPNLPIAFRSIPVNIDGYWPSYGSLNPQARRTYLEWLAAGRKDPDIDIGYVFLYFYGLERRAILDAALDSAIMRDYPLLAAELTRLLGIYGGHSKSFKKYARQLLDWVTFTNEQKIYATTNLAKVAGSLMKIKFALGQAAVDAAPIPAKLMLAWVKTDTATFALRTPAVRCSAQFDAVFETRYRETYGSGMVLAPNRTRLKFIYAPASSGFSSAADIGMSFKDIPDTTVSAKLTAAIQSVVEDATQAVEPFSRYLSRNPTGAASLEGLILLPPYLWPTELRQTLHGFKRSVLKAPLSMTCMELMQALGTGSALNKEKSLALAHSLSALSIGMEPDVVSTQKAPRPDDIVVLFDLPTVPDPTRDTASYKACLLTVQLASAVAASDGEFSTEEYLHLQKQVQQWVHLPVNQRKRLSAHLQIRRLRPIKLSALSKQLDVLTTDAKESVVAFMSALVQSDGAVTAKEVRLMEKVYLALGLDAAAYLAQHRAVLDAAKTVKVQPRTKPVAGAPVRKTFQLDPAKIAALQQDTAKVSELLENIFSPKEDALDAALPAPAPIQPASEPTAVSTETPKAPTVQLDMAKIAALQQDTEKVGLLLANIFVEENEPSVAVMPADATDDTDTEETKPDVATPAAPLIPGLDAAHDAFARIIVARHQWSRAELQDVANDLELMLDGALERLNDASFDAFDTPLTEGDDPIDIHPDTKAQLPS